VSCRAGRPRARWWRCASNSFASDRGATDAAFAPLRDQARRNAEARDAESRRCRSPPAPRGLRRHRRGRAVPRERARLAREPRRLAAGRRAARCAGGLRHAAARDVAAQLRQRGALLRDASAGALGARPHGGRALRAFAHLARGRAEEEEAPEARATARRRARRESPRAASAAREDGDVLARPARLVARQGSRLLPPLDAAAAESAFQRQSIRGFRRAARGDQRRPRHALLPRQLDQHEGQPERELRARAARAVQPRRRELWTRRGRGRRARRHGLHDPAVDGRGSRLLRARARLRRQDVLRAARRLGSRGKRGRHRPRRSPRERERAATRTSQTSRTPRSRVDA
jgi:hypothetical protein